jgi:hypothetical protein
MPMTMTVAGVVVRAVVHDGKPIPLGGIWSRGKRSPCPVRCRAPLDGQDGDDGGGRVEVRWEAGDLVLFTLRFEHSGRVKVLAVVVRPGS